MSGPLKGRQICGPSTLLSSRKPDDLPAFCDALVTALASGKVAS